MLKIAGRSHKLCDGISRRDALKIGGLGLGGLSLPQLLQAEARAGLGKSQKSIIMIYMCGAPSHQDMYDLKMDAPSEIRGEYRPIETSVPGLQICEHLPNLAQAMDKCVPLRSVYGSPNGAHDSFICYTGHTTQNQPPGGWPSLGSTISRVQGPTNPAIPAFVGLSPDTGHPPYGSPGHPGFLGVGHAAFRPSGPTRKDMVLGQVDGNRLSSRKELLASLDSIRRNMDASGTMAGLDLLTQQAFDILTSSKLVDALDISKEPQEVRDRYGNQGSEKNYGDGAPTNPEHFLMARRLVEAGARVVTLNFGRWDFHSNHFDGMKKSHLPQFDQALSALINDLHERGMADDVAVVAWGEFGRTPRINKDAGRDHWPQVGGALLAGGGFRTGQVIGATDRLGAEITERPIHFGEVFASLYKFMGLDPHTTTVDDFSGRPQYLVDQQHHALPELM